MPANPSLGYAACFTVIVLFWDLLTSKTKKKTQEHLELLLSYEEGRGKKSNQISTKCATLLFIYFFQFSSYFDKLFDVNSSRFCF